MNETRVAMGAASASEWRGFPAAARAALADEQLRANLRNATRTIRASVPGSPEVSPARLTMSPTTTRRWPSSRAVMAVTSRSPITQ